MQWRYQQLCVETHTDTHAHLETKTAIRKGFREEGTGKEAVMGTDDAQNDQGKRESQAEVEHEDQQGGKKKRSEILIGRVWERGGGLEPSRVPR